MKVSERVAQLRTARTPFVHATVVRAQHPTSAQPGDEAILLSDGTIEGFVGGQCAQNSVRKAALGALQTNQSVLLRVLPDGDVHFPEAPGSCVVVNPCLSGGALEIFLVPQLPAPLIGIRGATPIADALADICGVLGYDVQRDDAGAAVSPTALVIATHGGPEADTIMAALEAGVGYIGLVASKVRGRAILDQLELTKPSAPGCTPRLACRSVPRLQPRSRSPFSPRSSGGSGWTVWPSVGNRWRRRKWKHATVTGDRCGTGRRWVAQARHTQTAIATGSDDCARCHSRGCA